MKVLFFLPSNKIDVTDTSLNNKEGVILYLCFEATVQNESGTI